jgi:two-component system, NarL family, sensor histidine kinase LiaS
VHHCRYPVRLTHRRSYNAVEKKSPKQSDAISNAVIEERQRISRELHDRVLQLLSSVRMRAENCRRRVSHDRSALEKELHIIEENVDKAITEIRNLLTENQNPEDLQAGSLERRLKQELGIFRARTGFKLDFQCAIDTHNLPTEVERELYFALREGILNAVRHSRATELHLSLTKTPNGCQARLRDNGEGFDIGSTEGSTHYGIKGMRERIRKIGGEFDLQSAPGKGTQIQSTIPFKSH